MSRGCRVGIAIGLWLCTTLACVAQPANIKSLKTSLATYFQQFEFGFNGRAEAIRVEDVKIDDKNRIFEVYLGEQLGYQPFTQEKVERVYNGLREQLPQTYRNYHLSVYSKGQLLDELIIGGARHSELKRTWGNTGHQGNAWVTPLNRAFAVKSGLQDRHISLWASHGRFYSISEGVWRWQRPRLYCTTEDLFSQTFVVPYLIPMLENAGAVVWTPRERDWQRHEVIVDNDTPGRGGAYVERTGERPWEEAGTGFAQRKEVYLDGDNPFSDGTARKVATQSHKSSLSSITWTPAIPEDGRYAVYVSYVTVPTSVDDAIYTVHHRGQTTAFRVNQQMGGGTWVYLGTFDFAAGSDADNCVVLTNQSNRRGHITADAVRFGGGMGNIARGDSTNLSVSGLPRFLEAARYSAQWAGFPYHIYGNKEGKNDYAEDINVRSYAANFLARGSVYFPPDSAYVPIDSGRCVPLEVSIALHTDAGYTRDDANIGSLSIYTTDFLEGFLPAGLSRLTSRDFSDIVLSQVDGDMRSLYGHWTRRQMFDRNYSETREPRVPGIILEMLSHQNFADMRMAHDPTFKFNMSRAIYKGILRFLHRVHGSNRMVVQPLPVTAPAAFASADDSSIRLSWQPVEDPLESSATPSGFIVYHAIGNGDFDNGTFVENPRLTIKNAQRGVLHRFYITAANDGGQSMPSEEVCAFVAASGDKSAIVIDAFNRLAGPYNFDNDSTLGFDFATDPGIPMAVMPGYCGRQLCFDKSGYGREGLGGLGYSESELEGVLIAGNTLDWSSRHARDLIAASGGTLTISSCTADAVTRADFDSREARMMDIVFGLERYDGYSYRMAKVFPETLRQAVATFIRTGGSLLVSGAYVGSDMVSDDERLFTRSVLKYEYGGTLAADSISGISGLNRTFDIYRTLNEQSYCVSSVDCLAPISPAYCAMVYGPVNHSAAVAYTGSDYRSITLGFPFESITDSATRIDLLRGICQFLMSE